MILKARARGRTLLKVIRPPRMKTLRAHLFGLTLALTALLTHLIFAPPAQRTILLALAWLVLGYLAGVILCLLYNFFAYLFLKLVHPEWFQLWFWYDPERIVNIIKTPIPKSDWDEDTRKLFEQEEFKVFNYCTYDEVPEPTTGKTMDHPYTIVFVANPFIRLRQQTNGKTMAVRDPIMDNVSLFLKSVYRALFSFEYNEVIGRPDIFSKIRVVTVNESNDLLVDTRKPVPLEQVRDQCYVREFLGTFETDPRHSEPDFNQVQLSSVASFTNRMLVPNLSMRQKIGNLVKEKTGIEHLDVILAISASPTHDMSTSRLATNDWQMNREQDGVYFTFSSDPFCEKGNEILKSDCDKLLCGSRDDTEIDQQGPCLKSDKLNRQPSDDRVMLHEFFADPAGVGLVAMSALDVRPKLPVHEFAHAMSSIGHGMIVDEYYDFVVIRNAAAEGEAEEPPAEVPEAPPGIVVNRIYRNPEVMKATHQVPVHKHFARYNGLVYESDRDHHIAAQGWYSYFPGRKNPEVRCTMEKAEDVFQFDELLTDFIYDRLWVKVNRDYLKR